MKKKMVHATVQLAVHLSVYVLSQTSSAPTSKAATALSESPLRPTPTLAQTCAAHREQSPCVRWWQDIPKRQEEIPKRQEKQLEHSGQVRSRVGLSDIYLSCSNCQLSLKKNKKQKSLTRQWFFLFCFWFLVNNFPQ